VIRSSAYHPQTYGQTERINQILEDMLRACVLAYPQKWDQCLPLAEFSYNNSYQESIKMAPFEALHGRRCRTPLNWSETGERTIFGPDMVQEAEEQVRLIQANLKIAQSRQKSYADKRRDPLVFKVGDHVYLKSITLERRAEIRNKREVSSPLHRSISDCGKMRSCGLSVESSGESFCSS